jgi:hypothetical protein
LATLPLVLRQGRLACQGLVDRRNQQNDKKTGPDPVTRKRYMAIDLKMPVSRPPRAVPLSTRLVVLFGGVFSGVGWFFFAFGMIFAWIFADKGD